MTTATTRPSLDTPSKQNGSKSLHDYVCIWSIPRGFRAHYIVQQLGDSLGKGAFGQVYRKSIDNGDSSKISLENVGALNWATGETVAVKEIQLSNIPKSELGEIMVCPSSWAFLSRF